MAKSATFGVLHLGIAFTVGYLLTGSVAIAGAITLVEPVANTIAHFFFDRWWTAREQRRNTAARFDTAPATNAALNGALRGVAS